jgi:hypothetical protein
MAIPSQNFIAPRRMRKPLIGAKGFRRSHWTRETSSRGHGGSPRKRALCVCEKTGRRRRRSVRKIGC